MCVILLFLGLCLLFTLFCCVVVQCFVFALLFVLLSNLYFLFGVDVVVGVRLFCCFLMVFACCCFCCSLVCFWFIV